LESGVGLLASIGPFLLIVVSDNHPLDEHSIDTSLAQCSAATNHLITNAVLNISSDLIIICIPMPLLFKVKLPKKNKAILLGIFLIGTFTVSP
jgi:hypothetical protein